MVPLSKDNVYFETMEIFGLVDSNVKSSHIVGSQNFLIKFIHYQV